MTEPLPVDPALVASAAALAPDAAAARHLGLAEQFKEHTIKLQINESHAYWANRANVTPALM